MNGYELTEKAIFGRLRKSLELSDDPQRLAPGAPNKTRGGSDDWVPGPPKDDGGIPLLTVNSVARTNIDFQIPDGSPSKNQTTLSGGDIIHMPRPWIRPTIKHGQTMEMGFGQRQLPGSTEPTDPWRVIGLLMIQIFVPTNTGTFDIARLTDWAFALYKDWRTELRDSQNNLVGRLRFRVPPSTVDVGTDGKWFQKNLNIPFERDGWS